MIAIAILAAAPAVKPPDCRPTETEPVCAFQSSPRGITIKALVPRKEVRCAELHYKTPTSRFPGKRSFGPNFPMSTLTFNAPDKGTYRFSVNWQVANNRGACAVPYSHPGGGATIVTVK
jgi:hypothetical protein